ncbi:unnamed protein product [Meganyctiphanes norvegica]|uniref:Uncharacterized protein n=1 Tax=Meganyctiphanes norvegica TaxID=48144 RepID=A0AAV2S6S6_MEGNR
MRTPRRETYYRICGARIHRGAALAFLALGVLWFLSGVTCIIIGAISFDNSQWCWDHAGDNAGNVCWRLDLLVSGVINTIGGIVLSAIMIVAIRSRPEVPGTTGQVFATTTGYPQQPGVVYYQSPGLQQSGMVQVAPGMYGQQNLVQGHMQPGVQGHMQPGVHGHMQPGVPSQGYIHSMT